MSKKLVINANSSETRIAATEDDKLVEISIERSASESLVGNIYKARVSRVLPGMQSAFIDIGLDRAAFLYGGDVIDFRLLKEAQHSPEIAVDSDSEFQSFRDKVTATPIEKLLFPGHEIVVQITKDPIGTKGARASMFLSIPGRYLVVMPDFHHIGISRRIEGDDQRNALIDQVRSQKPEHVGFIIRTAAQDAPEHLLSEDLNSLIKLNASLKVERDKTPAPSLLYKEPAIHVKTTRDMYNNDVDEIIVDNASVFEDLRTFLKQWIPEAGDKLVLYEGKAPIFDEFGIEMDIAKALGKKVWLPSGGYLIIEQTEALTSFDVNTGRFVGKVSAKETIRKTNLEAVREVVAQLRLRNLGGIIVIDLIDMEDQADKDFIIATLEELLRSDKARSNVLKISELGLVEMTRKRTNESLERRLTEDCPYCSGLGTVRSMQTLALDLIRDLQRHHIRTSSKEISVTIRKDLQDWIMKHEKMLFEEVCREWDLSITFTPSRLTPDLLLESPYELA